MPCHDGRDDVRLVYREGHDPHYQEEAQRLSDRCATLTNLLCQIGRARYNKTNIPKDVLDWWAEHCKNDNSHGEPW